MAHQTGHVNSAASAFNPPVASLPTSFFGAASSLPPPLFSPPASFLFPLVEAAVLLPAQTREAAGAGLAPAHSWSRCQLHRSAWTFCPQTGHVVIAFASAAAVVPAAPFRPFRSEGGAPLEAFLLLDVVGLAAVAAAEEEEVDGFLATPLLDVSPSAVLALRSGFFPGLPGSSIVGRAAAAGFDGNAAGLSVSLFPSSPPTGDPTDVTPAAGF